MERWKGHPSPMLGSPLPLILQVHVSAQYSARLGSLVPAPGAGAAALGSELQHGVGGAAAHDLLHDDAR